MSKDYFSDLDDIARDFAAFYFDTFPEANKIDRTNVDDDYFNSIITTFISTTTYSPEDLILLQDILKNHSIVKMLDEELEILDYIALAKKDIIIEDEIEKNQAQYGKGAMGVVKQGYSLNNDCVVAVKVQKINPSTQEELNYSMIQLREEDEIIQELYKSIYGRNIREFNEDKREYYKARSKEIYGFKLYSIMPVFQGGELFDYVGKNIGREHSYTDVLKQLLILRNAAEQIQELHSLGYIHADIKLENIMLRVDQNLQIDYTENPTLVALVDFGLALKLDNTNIKYKRGEYDYEQFKLGKLDAIKVSLNNNPVRMGTELYFTLGEYSPAMTPDANGVNEVGEGIYTQATDMFAFGRLISMSLYALDDFSDKLQSHNLYNNIKALSDNLLLKNPAHRNTAVETVARMNKIINDFIEAHYDKIDAKFLAISNSNNTFESDNTTSTFFSATTESSRGWEDISEVEDSGNDTLNTDIYKRTNDSIESELKKYSEALEDRINTNNGKLTVGNKLRNILTFNSDADDKVKKDIRNDTLKLVAVNNIMHELQSDEYTSGAKEVNLKEFFDKHSDFKQLKAAMENDISISDYPHINRVFNIVRPDDVKHKK